LWLQNVDIALDRITIRFKKGGHNIPDTVVRRRYKKSLLNFQKYYQPAADFWAVFDNSLDTPQLIAFKEKGSIQILNHQIYDAIGKRKE